MHCVVIMGEYYKQTKLISHTNSQGMLIRKLIVSHDACADAEA